LTAIIDHSPNFAENGTGDDAITDPESAILDEQGSHGAFGAIEVSFDDGSLRQAIGVSDQFLHFCHQEDHFQQIIEIFTPQGANGNHDRLTAPIFGHQSLFGQFLFNPVGVS